MMIRTFIFDLDGTLIESAEDIRSCAIDAMKSLHPDYDLDPNLIQIGPPLSSLANSLTAKVPGFQSDAFISRFKSLYDSSDYPKTKLIQDTIPLLNSLANLGSLHIATNKRSLPTARILEKLAIRQLFKSVISPDCSGGQALSKAQMLAKIFDTEHILPQKALFFGDTILDMSAAKAVNTYGALYLNGYLDGEKNALPLAFEYASQLEGKQKALMFIKNDQDLT